MSLTPLRLFAGSVLCAASLAAASSAAAGLLKLDAHPRGGQFLIQLTAESAFAAPIAQVLIDADDDADTGHRLGAAGFDLLVEGGQVHRFAGDSPKVWQWEAIGSVQRGVDGRVLTLGIDGELVAGNRIGILARTLTADYQQVLSRVPAQGVSHIDVPSLARGTEAAGDADEASRDVTAASLVQDGDTLRIQVTMREPSDFAQTLVFLDRDGDDATGYQPAGSTHGFELMINGGTLSKHVGDDPATWQWQALSLVQRRIDGDQLTIEVNAGAIDAARVSALVMSMSADWMTPVDRAPDRGLYHLELDLSQVTHSSRAPVALAPPKDNRSLPARQRVAQMEDFYVYYGSGQVPELSHYDLVIAHPQQFEPDDIAALKQLGVVVVGYISVGEDDELHKGNGEGPGGYASWYFDEDGDDRPDQNAIWKSWFANPDDPAWRANRLTEARRLVEQEGYDGIFLDTIDTVALHPEAQDGMVKLVESFREAMPESVIILNQGLTLLDRLAPYADALMIESFTATYDFDSGRYRLQDPASMDWHARRVDQYIAPVLETHPLEVLILDYALPGDTRAIQAAADRAATFGFHFAAAPIYLDHVYQLDIQGEPDPKWLEKQATPRRLSIVLDEPANGFPAGTRVMPSGAYGGYKVATVVDGVRDRGGLPWDQAAWASAEDGREAWLAFEFPEPVTGGELVITWARDHGDLHVSQNYRVQVRRAAAAPWTTVAHAQGESTPVSAWPLPDEPFSAVRIIQPPGGGSPSRPDLMWVAQVQRRADETMASE